MKTSNRFPYLYFGRETKLVLALLIIAFGMSFNPTGKFSSLATPGQQGGIYSDAQARRGQRLYESKCASCHGVQLEGGSSVALAGSRFMAKWGGGNHNVDELYYITRTQMPYGAGGTLTNQQYIDIVAYMLKANGYKPGARDLALDSAALKQIKIEPQGSSKERIVEAQAPGDTKTTASNSQPSRSEERRV